MPDEFDFHKYKSMEEYSKTMEGSKYLHDLYLKAVNHPVRREILSIILKKRILKNNLVEVLIKKNIIKDENHLTYHIDYLLKAFCISSTKNKNGEVLYEITQSGKIIEHLK